MSKHLLFLCMHILSTRSQVARKRFQGYLQSFDDLLESTTATLNWWLHRRFEYSCKNLFRVECMQCNCCWSSGVSASASRMMASTSRDVIACW
ncbi:hypothetical protein EV702DRAFT_1117585 [Suillus placidus]|uniref:Secreted protein n=1 Tax=Suillus placidus TaxID=48579 RepID=A0A9P7D1D1_9AGAM|nr:hypothetical protein EV702DRAFT_1117585 [Suillus placidus]